MLYRRSAVIWVRRSLDTTRMYLASRDRRHATRRTQINAADALFCITTCWRTGDGELNVTSSEPVGDNMGVELDLVADAQTLDCSGFCPLA